MWLSARVLFAYHAQVPQQDNFCDCGVYVLQYMESLFQVSSDSYTQAKNTVFSNIKNRCEFIYENFKGPLLTLTALFLLLTRIQSQTSHCP